MVLFLGTMFLVSCDSEPDEPYRPSKNISVSPSEQFANIGDNVEFSLTFSGFEETPQQVTVTLKKEGDNKSIQYTLDVTDGKISISTSELSEGNYLCTIPYGSGAGFWLYLKQSFAKVTQVNAAQSTKYANKVDVKWETSVKADSYSSYYIYYGKTNNTESAKSTSIYAPSLNEATGKYESVCNVELSSSGTYYLWIALKHSDDSIEYSSPATCDFVYNKSYLCAKQSETEYNKIDVIYYDPIERPKYKVYYNSTNSTATASFKLLDYSDSTSKSLRDLLFNLEKTGFYENSTSISFAASGTYYFWIKEIDSLGYESDFSDPVTCTFTYAQPAAPVNVTAVKQNDDTIKVTWKDSKKASKYYIYAGKTNDSSIANRVYQNGYVLEDGESFKGEATITLSETGTYYIWVKGLDENSYASNFSQVVTVEN